MTDIDRLSDIADTLTQPLLDAGAALLEEMEDGHRPEPDAFADRSRESFQAFMARLEGFVEEADGLTVLRMMQYLLMERAKDRIQQRHMRSMLVGALMDGAIDFGKVG